MNPFLKIEKRLGLRAPRLQLDELGILPFDDLPSLPLLEIRFLPALLQQFPMPRGV